MPRRFWNTACWPGSACDIDALPVCHDAYVLSHNNVNKTPDWVLERLNKSQFAGGKDRPKTKFQPEKVRLRGMRRHDVALSIIVGVNAAAQAAATWRRKRAIRSAASQAGRGGLTR